MVTQMRTRAIIEHERSVTVWYKACPEVKGINPQVMVIWPAKLNYELDLAETKLSLSADGVLHVDDAADPRDDPSVPSEVGEYMAQTSFWTLESEQAIVMREMQKATPLARHLTAYFLRNDVGLSEHFKEELETYLRGIAGALGVPVTRDRDRDPDGRREDPAAPGARRCAKAPSRSPTGSDSPAGRRTERSSASIRRKPLQCKALTPLHNKSGSRGAMIGARNHSSHSTEIRPWKLSMCVADLSGTS